MAIELHEKFKGDLVSKLAPLLAEIKFSSGTFIDFETIYPLQAIDSLLVNRKELQSKLVSLLGENPLSTFFSGHVTRILADNADYDKDKAGFITELEYFGSAEELANKLVALVESLGWSYTVTWVLPETLSWLLATGVDQYVLSGNTRLLKVNEGVQKEFPLTSEDRRVRRGEGLFHRMGANELPEGRVLFQTQVSGYVGIYGASEALRRAETRLKAFLGFLLASRIMRVSFNYVQTPPRHDVIVYERHGGNWAITRKEKVEDDLSKLLAKLEVSDVDGAIKEEQLEGWVKFGLARIRSGFADDVTSNRLQLSAKWLLESYANSMDLLGFVQAMVSLEIILGDQDDTQELGLGATIRNRCAYLIGQSQTEREEISDQLKAIYKVRSKIVHTGKDRLMRDEYAKLFMLRDYCGRVLARELEIAANK